MPVSALYPADATTLHQNSEATIYGHATSSAAKDLITAHRNIIVSEDSYSNEVLNKISALIGSQKLAINAYAELHTSVAVDYLSSKLFSYNDYGDGNGSVEVIGSPGQKFRGNFDGNFIGNIAIQGGTLEPTQTGATNSFFVHSNTTGQLDNVIIGAHSPQAATFTNVNYNDENGVQKSLADLDSVAYANQTDISTNTTNIATNASGIAANVTNIGTLTSLNTTQKDNLVNAVNELNSGIQTNITDIAANATTIAANTTDISTNTTNIATNASGIATNVTNIGTLTSLNTTQKDNLVNAVNELNSGIQTNITDIATNSTNITTNTNSIGTLTSLDTSEKSNLVGAINELHTEIDTNYANMVNNYIDLSDQIVATRDGLSFKEPVYYGFEGNPANTFDIVNSETINDITVPLTLKYNKSKLNNNNDTDLEYVFGIDAGVLDTKITTDSEDISFIINAPANDNRYQGVWIYDRTATTNADDSTNYYYFKRREDSDFNPNYEMTSGSAYPVRYGTLAGTWVVDNYDAINKVINFFRHTNTYVNNKSKINEVIGAVNAILDLMAQTDTNGDPTEVSSQIETIA